MAQARIVRAKGLVWLSTQQSHWQQGMASLAGRRFQVAFGNPWAAVVRKPGQELTEALSAIWEEPYGDRRTELRWFAAVCLIIALRHRRDVCSMVLHAGHRHRGK